MSAPARTKNNLKIREKVLKLKDQIDDAEDRDHCAKESLKQAEALITQHQSDCSSKKNQIAMTKKALDEKRTELDKKEKRLMELTTKQDREIELVKTLETKEQDCDEELNYKEETHKKIQEVVESREKEVQELKQKVTQLVREVEKASERETTALNKTEELQLSITQKKNTLDTLKKQDDDSYERENESEIKLAFLKEELQTRSSDAEEKERTLTKLEEYKAKLEAEVEGWKNRRDQALNEIKQIQDLDDELYDSY